MVQIIDSFTGENKIYSNFYPVVIQFEGLNFPTIEHAFVASKSKEFFFRKLMRDMPAEKAGLVKKRGKDIRLRGDWEAVKVDFMINFLTQKFSQDPFKTKLLATDDAEICEGNYWHDNDWGNCKCEKCIGIDGENLLGRLIMDVRSELREKDLSSRRRA